MAAVLPGMIAPVGAMLRVHMFTATEFVKEPGDESACRQRVVAQAMNAYNAWVGRNAARPINVENFVTDNRTTSCANARLLMESVITVTYRGDDNA